MAVEVATCRGRGGAYRGGPTAVTVLVIVTMLVLIFSQKFQDAVDVII